MATHSGVLAWRIPGTGEPGGQLSMGSHRVGHNWSDLAAATVWTVTNSYYCPYYCLLTSFCYTGLLRAFALAISSVWHDVLQDIHLAYFYTFVKIQQKYYLVSEGFLATLLLIYTLSLFLPYFYSYLFITTLQILIYWLILFPKNIISFNIW